MSDVIDFLFSVFRISCPLMLAAMGGLLSERSGVIHIALEGKMLFAAMVSAAVASVWTFNGAGGGAPWAGLGAGVLAGIVLGGLYGICVISFRANQIVAGTAINLFAFGITPFLCKAFFGVTSSTPMLNLNQRFVWEPLPLTIIILAFITFLYGKTRWGLRVQFAGEHPEAAESEGISVVALRWQCLILAGVLSGVGGAMLSTYLASGFSRSMTAGRGFMALACVIFGRWKPIPTIGACLLFGLFETLQIRMQGTVDIAVQWIQALPYVATLFALAGIMGTSRPPKKLGVSLALFFVMGASLIQTSCTLKKAEVVAPSGPTEIQRLEIFGEMTRLVYAGKPIPGQELNELKSMLFAQASLEGIYNRMVQGGVYAELEQRENPATSQEIETFEKWVQILESTSGLKLVKSAEQADLLGSSKFRLRRILGEFALQIMDRLWDRLWDRLRDGAGSDASPGGQKFQKWYVDFAVRVAKQAKTDNLDLGHPTRLSVEPKVHLEFAQKKPRDILFWEVIGRLYRVGSPL